MVFSAEVTDVKRHEKGDRILPFVNFRLANSLKEKFQPYGNAFSRMLVWFVEDLIVH